MRRAPRPLLATLLGLAACVASPQEEASREVARLDAAIAALESRLQTCRRESGYRPPAEAETGLAPGEAPYRECLYRGMEEILLPAIAEPEPRGWFHALISEDRRLTEAVAAGRIRRGERQVRLDAAWRDAGDRYRTFAERRAVEQRIDRLDAERKRFEPNKSVLEIQDRLNVINTMLFRR
jgi:hypothetical protein